MQFAHSFSHSSTGFMSFMLVIDPVLLIIFTFKAVLYACNVNKVIQNFRKEGHRSHISFSPLQVGHNLKFLIRNDILKQKDMYTPAWCSKYIIHFLASLLALIRTCNLKTGYMNRSILLLILRTLYWV